MRKSGLISEIFKKCYFITTHSKCDVFFSYSAHVDFYTVYYYLNGWTKHDEPVFLNNSSYIKITNLKNTMKELEKIWALIEENNLSN